jgi:glyoxylase-like metal-dependent hydrolase (beta-lactamase superfamily II)
MSLQIAERWFERRAIDDDITHLWEPHVVPLMRCNIWHVRGRDRDLFIDTGMGVASLKEAAYDLLDKPVTAVATHTHGDHVGGHGEFDHCLVHRDEAQSLEASREGTGLGAAGLFGPEEVAYLQHSGYEIDLETLLITALPHAGYDPDAYRVLPAPASEIVDAGDVVDTGDRAFEVIHLPGHSPGSIGLWEADTGILFSGDCVYDGPLLDGFEDSDIAFYIDSMKRLRDLPVRVVHAGHDPSFDRDRLHELIDAYLSKRDR